MVKAKRNELRCVTLLSFSGMVMFDLDCCQSPCLGSWP